MSGKRSDVGALTDNISSLSINSELKAHNRKSSNDAIAPEPGSDEFSALCHSLDHRPLGYRVAKRAFDIIFSAGVCVLGLVPGIILSVAVTVDTKGFPIYSQIRVGKHGKPFRIYKFRSMVADADDVEKYFSSHQLAEWERERKVENDPRITPLGRIIRKTSIDEFPQFINVLFGKMSVVGPRAITYAELREYGDDASSLLSVEPGITGAWQCGPRNLATFENGMRQKLELSYVKCASLGMDFRLFFKTFSAMFVDKTGR